MRAFSVLLLLCLAGCSTTFVGRYNTEVSVFGGQSIIFREDGSYEYSLWSDDLDENCSIVGSYVFLDERHKEVKLEVESVSPGRDRSWCFVFPKIEIWTVRRNSVVRPIEGSSGVRFVKFKNAT